MVEDVRQLPNSLPRGRAPSDVAVDLASNGREGRNYLHLYSYDLFVLD